MKINLHREETISAMKLINPEIRFEVTNKCNARCVMCPREKLTRKQGVMDVALYRRVLDEAAGYGAKQATLENFGESLLDPHIFDRAAYARSKGLKTYIVTNASLLDEDKCARAVEVFDRIRISMYGNTKDTYEKIHAGLSFEMVRRNVDLLFRLRDKAASRVKIEMYFLQMKENEHETEDFIRHYNDVADDLSVWKPHNWGSARIYRRGLAGERSTCGRPASGPVQVQWDGLVVPCCFDYDSKIVLGDLNRQTLKEILQGDGYNALREAHEAGDFRKYPVCNICDQLYKVKDILVYSKSGNVKVGSTYATQFDLSKNAGSYAKKDLTA